MILRGSTPRTLTGAGFLALFGLGVVLLPLVPSWAQDRPRREPKTEGAADPDRARADLQKARANLQKMMEDLKAARRDLDAKSAALQERLEQIQRN